MNGQWNQDNSPAAQDKRFKEAVKYASQTLETRIERARANELAIKEIDQLAPSQENGVLVLDRYIPPEHLSAYPDVKFYIYPSNRGGYNIQPAPVNKQRDEVENHFPQEWPGNTDKDLGITFCHRRGFLAVCASEQEARRIAKVAVKCQEEGISTDKAKTLIPRERQSAPAQQTEDQRNEEININTPKELLTSAIIQDAFAKKRIQHQQGSTARSFPERKKYLQLLEKLNLNNTGFAFSPEYLEVKNLFEQQKGCTLSTDEAYQLFRNVESYKDKQYENLKNDLRELEDIDRSLFSPVAVDIDFDVNNNYENDIDFDSDFELEEDDDFRIDF